MSARDVQYNAGIEDIFDQVRDHDTDNFCSQVTDHVFKQVVSEWPGRTCSLEFDSDSVCFSMRYPDKQIALLLGCFQDDDSLRRLQIYAHAFNCHLNHVFVSLFHGCALSSL